MGGPASWMLQDAHDVGLDRELVNNLKSAYLIDLASDKVKMTSAGQEQGETIS